MQVVFHYDLQIKGKSSRNVSTNSSSYYNRNKRDATRFN